MPGRAPGALAPGFVAQGRQMIVLPRVAGTIPVMAASSAAMSPANALLLGSRSRTEARFYLDLVDPRSVRAKLPAGVFDLDDLFAYLDAGQLVRARIVLRRLELDTAFAPLLERLRGYPGSVAGPILSDLATFGKLLPFDLAERLASHPAGSAAQRTIDDLRARRSTRIAVLLEKHRAPNHGQAGREFVLAAMALASSFQTPLASQEALVSFLVTPSRDTIESLLAALGPTTSWVGVDGGALGGPLFSLDCISGLARVLTALVEEYYLRLSGARPCPPALAQALVARGASRFDARLLNLRDVSAGLKTRLLKRFVGPDVNDPTLHKFVLTLPRELAAARPSTAAAILDFAQTLVAGALPIGARAQLLTELAAVPSLTSAEVAALFSVVDAYARQLPATVADALLAHPACPEDRFAAAIANGKISARILASPRLSSKAALAILDNGGPHAWRHAIAAHHVDPHVLEAALGTEPDSALVLEAINNPAATPEIIGRSPADPRLRRLRAPLARYYLEQLGTDRVVWSLALTLMESFEGTAAALVETVLALSADGSARAGPPAPGSDGIAELGL